MAKVATRVLEVDHGRVVLYPGGYEDYESTRLSRMAEAADREEREVRPASPAKGAAPARAAAPVDRKADRAADRAAQNAAKKKERELAKLESEISAREARVKALEDQLADPDLYNDVSRSRDIVAEYERVRAELESMWERLAELG
jgi:ATP-binding cassette subfamily F protein 3